jgi:hypothetical protein
MAAGVTIRVAPCRFRASRPLSPVTRNAASLAAASASRKLSLASRAAPEVSDYFLAPPSAPVMSENFPKPENKPAKPPAYCKPCLFYGGDFDDSLATANGLWNGVNSELGIAGEVLVPFTIPKGQIWFVSGLFTNNLSNVSVIDPKKANWSISKGVTTGSGGHTIAKGTAPATYTPTGRSGFGLTEYTVLVKIEPLALGPGTYWLTVAPLCTNSADSACTSALYYESDTEDSPPLNHYGPLEPNDMSYFNSASFLDTYAPTWGASGACSGVGCDRFSAGVLGFGL